MTIMVRRRILNDSMSTSARRKWPTLSAASYWFQGQVGMKMVFQNTPDTEAPVEMNTWFPELKAFRAAENVTGTIHNIYTLRGAPTVRSPKSLVIRTFGGIRPGDRKSVV